MQFPTPEALLAWYMTRWIRDGNKTFRLSQEMVDAFSHVELNVPSNSYMQPYPCVKVVFPDGGETILSMDAEVMVFDQKARKSLFFIDVPRLHRHLGYGVFRLDVDSDLEAQFEPEGDLELAERAVFRQRVAINAMLLACNHPTRVIRAPAVNPNLPHRIVRQRQLARHEFIEFIDQDIKWYDVQRHPTEGTGQPGSVKRPHWRKGHYRRQRIGEGRVNTKYVFIKPILVNAEYFIGNESRTVYTAV